MFLNDSAGGHELRPDHHGSAPEARGEVRPARERWEFVVLECRAPDRGPRRALVLRAMGQRRRDTLSHTYFQNVMHVVFSTKERRKTIPKAMKERLWSYAAGICKHQDIFVHAIGGMEEHIHLLLQFPPTILVPTAIMKIKANSSGWMSDQIGKFAWQQGYGAFSVSKSNIPVVVRYIQNQERHHRTMSFEEEFIALLEKHGIEYDPRYVFG